MTAPEAFDVVIAGGGLAGLCLTRLLALEHPELGVITIDRGAGPARKVGESTVEIGAHFLSTRLQLADLLRRTQLPKNGLRFWFDDEARATPFAEASEDGPVTFSWWQSFQLDRERLETDLIELGRSAGARHLYGASDLTLESGPSSSTPDAPHVVTFDHDGARRRVAGRWLVDATGVAAALGRRRGLLEAEARVPHGGCWARFRGARCLHRLLRDGGDRRMLRAHRLLSTNHLMHEGYWIWLIPLPSGLLSVGLVYDETVLRDPPATLEAFRAFLAEHAMAAEVLDGAEPIDFGRLRGFAWKPERWIDADERTASIGLAAGFVDPFYSSGSDLIAIECEAISDLVAADRCGAGPADLAPRAIAANAVLEAFYEQAVRWVGGVYRSFASFELSVPRYRRDLHVYWGIFVWPYLSGQLRDPAFVERWIPLAHRTRARSEFFGRLFAWAYDRLKAQGRHRRGNRGEYAFNQLGYRTFPALRFERSMGRPLELDLMAELQDESDALGFLAVLDVLWDGDRAPLRRPLYEAVHGETLEALIALAASDGFDESFWREVGARIGRGVAESYARAGAPLDADPTVDATSFGALRRTVLGLAGDDADRRTAATRHWNALPALRAMDDFDPVALRDAVQPAVTWSLDASPWGIGELDWTTVYDVLADRWAALPVRAEAGPPGP